MDEWPPPKLNFAPIDPTIDRWSQDNGLILFREYKDCDVRSVYLNDSEGRRRVQIWIDPLEETSTTVHVWKIPQRRRENEKLTPLVATIDTSAEVLDESLKLGKTWL